MRRAWKEIGSALLLGLLLPALVFNTARILRDDPTVPTDAGPQITGATEVETEELKIAVLMEDGTIARMALEEYIAGVVLGEMPASFEMEALKAQAVVARTYTLRLRERGVKHPDGGVCTDPACCQDYEDPDLYLEQGGTQADIDKIKQAVAETAGLVLTYEGELIEATYFSSSGGRTEDAVAVWGNDVPYLRSTDSPEQAYAVQTTKTVTLTAQEFQTALGTVLSGPCETWLGTVTYTDGGGVDTMLIGGTAFTGTQLRQLLGLRSTAFTMTAVGEHILITTRGYGHRVGMSQYGAEAMAVSGSTFREILSHYYQGTVLSEYIDNGGELG